jgi:hypothetical protein
MNIPNNKRSPDITAKKVNCKKGQRERERMIRAVS